MKKLILLTLAACLMTVTILPASATPINYKIDFTAGAGPVPTGSFTHDASLGLGSQFAVFQVDWSGLLFDLTDAANAFIFRTDSPTFANSCAGVAGLSDAFLVLSGAQCVADELAVATWNAAKFATSAAFFFMVTDNTPAAETYQLLRRVPYDNPGPPVIDQGVGFDAFPWRLTEVPGEGAGEVPEPATFALVAGAWGLMGWKRSRQTRTRRV